jgi:adenine-specific DNA-methyltransferase
MATGVPKRRRPVNSSRLAKEASLLVSASHLQYSGKKSEAEVLATPPANIATLWSGLGGEEKNRLYFGDNQRVLARLLNDTAVRGKVRLVYIDPPFATQTTFHSRKLEHAYEDTLYGAEFIESLRWRLILLRELLASDGSIYLHLDEKMVFHIKVVMDEVFGPDNYRNCITRKKCNPKNYTRKKYGNVSDYILFYTKSEDYVWNRPVEPWTESRAKEYQYVEPETGRRFMKVPVHAPGVRHGETGKPWRGMLPPPGKHWQFPPSKLDEFDAAGQIFWSANGNPRRKVYLDESDGVGVQDIWTDFRDAHNQNICITGYPTEKNPDLLKRIIEASSNPGDLVLDCYSGSGTTLAVADRLGRRWIGIDNSPEAIKTTLQRFAIGTQPMGDFVTSRRDDEQEKTNRYEDRQSTLFGNCEDAFHSSSLPATHTPVLGFVLMGEPHLIHLVADSVDAWQNRPTTELHSHSKVAST